MERFGDLNGVTASSLLLLDEDAVGFLKACNKSIDEINLSSMSTELAYLQTVSNHIEGILKSKPEFNIQGSENKDQLLDNLLSALCMVIKNRTGLDYSFEQTDLFSDDIFGDLFDDSDESDEGFSDLFGDESFEAETPEDETLLDNFNLSNLMSFYNLNKFTQDSVSVSDIDKNSITDEIVLFKEKSSMFEARCKVDPDSPINESKGIKRIISSGRGNPEVIDFIEKSYNRISIFHLTFNEVSGLINEIDELNIFSDNSSSEVESDFPEKVEAIGDYLAYFIYSNMHKKSYTSGEYELVERLIKLCDAKSSHNSSKSKVLGIPLNLCYLKFKGSNYRDFCKTLETAVDNIPEGDLNKYYIVIKNILDSLEIISDYIDTVSFNRHADSEYEAFRDYVGECALSNSVGEGYSKVAQEFLKELKNRKLLCSKSQISKYGDEIDDAIDSYVSEIYDTFKLYSLSEKFSTDYYNSLLPQEIIDNFGVIDIETLLQVDDYLRKVYRIIPLTLSNYVKSKILATSKTNKVTEKEIYSAVKPALKLAIENFESKYSAKTNLSIPGTLIIS